MVATTVLNSPTTSRIRTKVSRMAALMVRKSTWLLLASTTAGSTPSFKRELTSTMRTRTPTSKLSTRASALRLRAASRATVCQLSSSVPPPDRTRTAKTPLIPAVTKLKTPSSRLPILMFTMFARRPTIPTLPRLTAPTWPTLLL